MSPPSPLPGAAFGREQPLVPCGPAPLLLFAPCSPSWHPMVEPFLEHPLQPPTGTLNYHDGHRPIRDFAPQLISVLLREKDLKTSLQAAKLSISSSDAIIGTSLGKPKDICYQNER